jgi:uncharacterized RDD family membrane protein YckC
VDSTAAPRWLADDEACLPSLGQEKEGEVTQSEISSVPPVIEAAASEAVSGLAEEPSRWRNEVADCLNRYQSKRKPRPPRYPSLRLPFEQGDLPRPSEDVFSEPDPFSQSSVSNHALALDRFPETPIPSFETPQPSLATHADIPPFQQMAAIPVPAKILEFPRSWTPPPVPLDELAEPVIDRPRILEVPEAAVPAPALGGITIDSMSQPELEKRPGIDIPLRSAPLARRILAAAIDDLIIALACTLFGLIFWKMTAIQPPRFQLLGLIGGFVALFWATYQYLLVIYSGSTPGLRLAKLELARFNGTPAPRSLRRWRVLASFLSAVSLGMGYAWVFLDEDGLCWHDRITHTYLAPKESQQ